MKGVELSAVKRPKNLTVSRKMVNLTVNRKKAALN